MNADKIRLLTITEAAEALRVSRARAYELVRLNLVPSVRLGRQIRIDADRLREHLNGGGVPLLGGWRKNQEGRRA